MRVRFFWVMAQQVELHNKTGMHIVYTLFATMILAEPFVFAAVRDLIWVYTVQYNPGHKLYMHHAVGILKIFY